MKNDLVSEKVLEKIKYVASYIQNATDDWLDVKKQILITLRPEERKMFSRRHKTSKKHFLNEKELYIIEFWKEITGVCLKIEPEKLHTKTDERPPRYWGLFELNKKRKEEARIKNGK